VSDGGLAGGLLCAGRTPLPLGVRRCRGARAVLSMEWSNTCLALEGAGAGCTVRRGRVLLLLTAGVSVSSVSVEGVMHICKLGDNHGPHTVQVVQRVCFQQLRRCTMTCGLELRIEFSLPVIPLSA